MSLGMLSLMAGLAGGYERGQQRDLSNQRQAMMDQIRLDAADRDKTTFEQQQSERQGLIDAAAPVAPSAAPPMDNGGVTVDDQGNPLPPQAPMASVNGQRVAADAAGPMAAAANTPAAMQERQLAFMQKTDPAKALRMQADITRATADKLDLATKKWNSDIDTAKSKGLEGLIKLADDSHADGEGGVVKSQVIYSPDNSTFTIGRLMPDGSVQPTKMPPLPNNQEGIDRLAASLQRGVPPDRLIAHYDQVTNQRALLADRQADNVRADKLAESTIGYHKAMAEAAGVRAGAAETRAEGRSVVDKMPEGDKIAYNAALKRREKMEEAITKAKADGSWDPEANKGHKSLQTDFDAANMKASLLEKRYTGNNIGGSDPYGARDEGGKKTVIGKGATPVTAPAAKETSPLQVSPAEVPDPPQHFVGRNGTPDRADTQYKAWEAKYGAAYAEKKRQEDAAAAAATAATRATIDARRDSAARASRGNV